MELKLISCFVTICFLPTLILLVGNCDAEQAACLEAAQDSPGWPGGWHPHGQGAQQDDVVMYFLQRALEDINSRANDMKFYALRDQPTVYAQVVAGTNYCIQFEAEAAGCKNANRADFCTEGSMTCSFRAFQPLPGAPTEPEIEEVLCD